MNGPLRKDRFLNLHSRFLNNFRLHRFQLCNSAAGEASSSPRNECNSPPSLPYLLMPSRISMYSNEPTRVYHVIFWIPQYSFIAHHEHPVVYANPREHSNHWASHAPIFECSNKLETLPICVLPFERTLLACESITSSNRMLLYVNIYPYQRRIIYKFSILEIITFSVFEIASVKH